MEQPPLAAHLHGERPIEPPLAAGDLRVDPAQRLDGPGRAEQSARDVVRELPRYVAEDQIDVVLLVVLSRVLLSTPAASLAHVDGPSSCTSNIGASPPQLRGRLAPP
ncbi:hypothetical protein [Sorangium sp. So ce204]|uniref:hypothetical protein n=1 Tax=Sorangium sp. So ce204 TaxID=3133288 RepID=UPI003F5EC1EE